MEEEDSIASFLLSCWSDATGPPALRGANSRPATATATAAAAAGQGTPAARPPDPPPPPPLPTTATATTLAPPGTTDTVSVSMASESTGTGNSKDTETAGMDTSGQVNLGQLYHQGRTARNLQHQVKRTKIIQNESGFNHITENTVLNFGFGFEADDESILKTFHGTRITKGQQHVNESISLSFDPNSRTCLMCPTEHAVIRQDQPLVMVLSDQNFPTNLSGGEGNCIPVARLEDASLLDLVGILGEILEKTKPVTGSVVLIGSGSHLVRNGACAYTFDWCEVVALCKKNWPTITVCPLVPIMSSDLPGHAARDILQLSVWLHETYRYLPNGLLPSWDSIVDLTHANCRGSTHLDSPETQKMPMPSDLESTRPATFVFDYDHTCPVQLIMPDSKAICGVITCLIDSLRTSFSVQVRPEAILGKAQHSQGEAQSSANKAIVIGASIMRQTIPYLKDCGLEVIDMTKGGWVASTASIGIIKQQLDSLLPDSHTILVLDLCSNSVHRFMQEDGTLALPIKLGGGGGYHLPGPVKLVGEDGLKKILDIVKPILDAAPSNPKIVIPPHPRYLGVGCCGEKTHCSNCKTPEYANEQLEGLSAIRKSIKSRLLTSGIRNFWVLDGIRVLAGFPDPDPGPGPSKETILGGLKVALAKDGVHLTDIGQKNLALAISSAAIRIRQRISTNYLAACRDPVSAARSRSQFWHGFTSPRGASRSHSSSNNRRGHATHAGAGSGSVRGRGAGHRSAHRPHPYLHKKN